jgi:hypothetical protein
MFRVKERFPSGHHDLGKESSDEYNLLVTGNPLPASQGGDNADFYPAALSWLLNTSGEVAIVSALGNVFSNVHGDRVTTGMWYFTITYKSQIAERQTNQASFSFQAGGGTIHIKNSIKATIYNNSGTTASQPNGAPINAGKDGSIGGLDIEGNNFSFKTTFYQPIENLTEGYMAELKSAAGCVNSDVVVIVINRITMTFQPGELRLRVIDGSERIGYGDMELAMQWAYAQNISNYKIQDVTGNTPGVTISQLNGWDYVDPYFGDCPMIEGSGTNFYTGIVQQIQYATVHQVYIYTALSGLLPAQTFGLTNTQPWTSPSLIGGGQ